MDVPEDIKHMHPALAVALALLAVIISAGFQALIATPFVGALTRLRANYNPRRVVLESENVEVDQYTGPRLRGIFATLARTYKLESWWGVYKGAYATFLTNVFVMLPLVATVGAAWSGGQQNPKVHSWASFVGGKHHHHPRPTRQQVIGEVVGGVIGALVAIPAVVLWTRAFVTPFRLPFSPNSMRALLSKTERERFWRLWLAPGLAAGLVVAWFSQWVITALAFPDLVGQQPIANAHGHGKHHDKPEFSLHIGKKYIPYIVVMVISTLWLTPLNVAITKIAAAPNYSTPNSGVEAAVERSLAADSDSSPERLAEQEHLTDLEAYYQRASREEEDTINLRSPPRYRSLVDAITTIKNEEGLGALYRGWIWTGIGNLVAALGAINLHKLVERM